MFINKIKSLFQQFQCGACRRCFKNNKDLDKHIKTCNIGTVMHKWCGGVYELPKNIKQCLASYGFDVSNHDFIYPHILVYDAESSFPTATSQPAAKRAKMCGDLNGVLLERILKFSTTHHLLSYSLATTYPIAPVNISRAKATIRNPTSKL